MEGKAENLIAKANEVINNHLNKLGNYGHKELLIDLQNLKIPDFNTPEEERLNEFLKFIAPITTPTKNEPVIYFFEIIKGDSTKIIKAYRALKKNNKSALKKQINFDTTCLYVGKSKKTLLHRLKVHFGYKDTTENGLQLLHWAKDKKLGLELKLHVYTFPKGLDFLLPFYEAEFNKAYKPLIGYL